MGMDRWPGERFGLPADGAGSAAGFGERFAGWLVDVALIVVASRFAPGWLYAVVALGDLVALPALWGRTAGQALLRLRMVPVVDGEALTGQRGLTVLTAFGRALALSVLSPYLWVSGDDDRRFAHDRWTSTAVVHR